MSFTNKILYQIKLITPFGLRRFLLNVKEGSVMREEDYVLKFFKEQEKKKNQELILVDVGAAAGNISLFFSKNGWKVFAIEPDDENRRKLINNIKIYNCDIDIDTHAISDKETTMPFYTSDVSAGIKGLNQFHSSHKQYKEVQTITLETFCKNKQLDNFNFLKIDTEGFDLNVLKSIDLQMHKIEVIMCEYDDNKTERLGYCLSDIISYLEQNDFIPIISEWYQLREYGKGHKWKRFTTNYNDVAKTSWGNIIAVKPEYFELMSGILKLKK